MAGNWELDGETASLLLPYSHLLAATVRSWILVYMRAYEHLYTYRYMYFIDIYILSLRQCPYMMTFESLTKVKSLLVGHMFDAESNTFSERTHKE